jgi:hypothetical protein
VNFKLHIFILSWVLILFATVLAADEQKAPPVEEAPVATHEDGRVIRMPEMDKEIHLPTKLWDLVTGASFEKSVKDSANFIFSPISVQFKEKNPGVLADPVMRFEFPNAGGEIDFAKYIKSERGTFQITFDFEGFADPASLQIYYMPTARKRKIDGEIFGAGCKKFYDLKDYILTANSKEGLVVNVTRDRHDSAVGGHFIFSYKKGKQTYISQVSFTDSKRPDLFCDASGKEQ